MAKDSNNKTLETFEKQLFKAADKLRKNIDAAEYKHVVLGLVFLKYISDSFEELYNKLKEGKGEYEGADPEDQDEYRAQNVFWVPQNARWSYLHSRAKLPSIGTDLDEAMELIEKENPTLKGILAKVYARPNLDKAALGGLIDLISNTALGSEAAKSKDLLGRVYEYFLGEFANAEGKKGGQFYTPKSIVRLLVEMVEPYKGRVYDPCCGSGGMFVMSEKFVLEHQGKLDDVSIYGQESNQTTYRLSRMNMAIRGIDGSQIKWNSEGSFLKDAHPDLKADFIIANPPFNQSDWGQEILRNDPRWQYGLPPTNNANFGWMQHMIYHLAPHGVMGLVLANGSLASNTSGEGEIRQRIVEADLVDCIVMLPSQLFYNTQISACLWFISRKKNGNGDRKRTGEILFIDANELGYMEDRTHRAYSEDDIQMIANTYHEWRKKDGSYKDVNGFCKSAAIEEIQKHNFVLTPSIYTGIPDENKTIVSIEHKLDVVSKLLTEQTQLSRLIDAQIIAGLEENYPSYNWKNVDFNSVEILEYIARELFHEWFVKFNFPNDNKKPYKLSGGAMQESELGNIPLKWRVDGLANIAEFLNGLALQKFPPQDESHYLPVVKIRELKSGITEQSDKASTDIDPKYIVDDGDVLFSWSGSLEVVLWKYGRGALNQHLFKVTSELYPKWFYYFWVLQHLAFFKRIAAGKATTMGHIQRHHLQEAKVFIPDEALLKRADTIFSPMLNKILLLNSQNAEKFNQ